MVNKLLKYIIQYNYEYSINQKFYICVILENNYRLKIKENVNLCKTYKKHKPNYIKFLSVNIVKIIAKKLFIWYNNKA